MTKPDDRQPGKEAAQREKPSPVKRDRELSDAELETIAAAGAAAKLPGPGKG